MKCAPQYLTSNLGVGSGNTYRRNMRVPLLDDLEDLGDWSACNSGCLSNKSIQNRYGKQAGAVCAEICDCTVFLRKFLPEYQAKVLCYGYQLLSSSISIG